LKFPLEPQPSAEAENEEPKMDMTTKEILAGRKGFARMFFDGAWRF
jgi:hypothetical protein